MWNAICGKGNEMYAMNARILIFRRANSRNTIPQIAFRISHFLYAKLYLQR